MKAHLVDQVYQQHVAGMLRTPAPPRNTPIGHILIKGGTPAVDVDDHVSRAYHEARSQHKSGVIRSVEDHVSQAYDWLVGKASSGYHAVEDYVVRDAHAAVNNLNYVRDFWTGEAISGAESVGSAAANFVPSGVTTSIISGLGGSVLTLGALAGLFILLK